MYFESESEARSDCTIPVTDLGRLRQNPYSQVARLERESVGSVYVYAYVYVGVSREEVDGSRMAGEGDNEVRQEKNRDVSAREIGAREKKRAWRDAQRSRANCSKAKPRTGEMIRH